MSQDAQRLRDAATDNGLAAANAVMRNGHSAAICSKRVEITRFGDRGPRYLHGDCDPRDATPQAQQVNAALDAIRVEYMRGISDAYAGGPRGRQLAWDRLREAIELYALRLADLAVAAAFRRSFEQAASDPAPTMSPAVEPSADPGRVDDGAAPADLADAAAPPARKPTSRRPRATRTDTTTREEES